jgi:hypothetical protein
VSIKVESRHVRLISLLQQSSNSADCWQVFARRPIKGPTVGQQLASALQNPGVR